MKKSLKIPAGALQFVVLVSVVIAILLAAFVTLTHTHRFFKKQSHAVVETVKNAGEGIQYALVNPIVANDSVVLPLFAETGSTVSVHRSYWGIFEKVTALSKTKNKRFVKTALAGGRFTPEERPALYLEDRDKPLILAGGTNIQGTAYLPDKAVRPGTISGQAYHGTTLIRGRIKKSSRQLPSLPQELITQLENITQNDFNFSAENIAEPLTDQPLHRSFHDPVQYLYSPGVFDLSGMHISGNVVICAREKIVIPATAHLSDVVLVAPEIEIRDGVNGTFQAIASSTIDVGNNVRLHYPSALVLKARKTNVADQETENRIFIGKQTTVKGVVLYLGNSTENNFSAQVILESGAAVYGELYCDQNVELKGTVQGSVYTSGFIVKKSGSIYQNHVFNATISGNTLPDAYTGLTLGSAQKNIIKWLY